MSKVLGSDLAVGATTLRALALRELGQVAQPGATTVAVAEDRTRGRVFFVQASKDVQMVDATLASTAGALSDLGRDAAADPSTDRLYVATDSGLEILDGATLATISAVAFGSGSFGVAVNSETNRIYVSSVLDNTVTVVDGTTNLVAAVIPVGNAPGPIAVDQATNRIYVANVGDSTVSVIDGATDTVIGSCGTGAGVAAIAANPETGRVYTANSFDGTVTRITDPLSPSAITITVGAGPGALVVDRQRNRIYVACFGSGAIWAVDGATDTAEIVREIAGPLRLALDEVRGRLWATTTSGVCCLDVRVGILATFALSGGTHVGLIPDAQLGLIATQGVPVDYVEVLEAIEGNETTTDELVPDSTGDLAVVEGTDCLRANLTDRLLTSAKELVLHPEFGGGLEDLVSAPVGTPALGRIRDELQAQLAADPRVEAVESLDLSIADRTLRIEFRVLAIGQQVSGNLVFPLG